jgi:hypothetical protein
MAGCQLLAGLDNRQPTAVDAGDGGTDARDPCSQVGVPDSPDAGAGGDLTIVFALRSIDLGLDAGAAYGFNLDRACTCPAFDTCVRPDDAGPACDQPPGVDNAGVALLRTAAAQNLLSEEQANNSLSQGLSGLLVRIDRYNGLGDDALVHVAVFTSLGADGVLDGGTLLQFDGGDRWTVEETSVKGQLDGGYAAVAEDTSAYVSGGVMVARLDFPIVIGSTLGPPITFDMSSGIIVATLARKDAQSYTLSGTLAGRWAASQLLTSFEAYPDPFQQGRWLCGDDPTYLFLKQTVCRGVDIHKRADSDGITTRCDAYSVGVRFTAVSALFGSLVSRPDASHPCGASWSDNCP